MGRRPLALPHYVGRITLGGVTGSTCLVPARLGSGGTTRPRGGRNGAADGPHPAPTRRLTDVKDNRDATVHGGRATGPSPVAAPDEQGEVTA